MNLRLQEAPCEVRVPLNTLVITDKSRQEHETKLKIRLRIRIDTSSPCLDLNCHQFLPAFSPTHRSDVIFFLALGRSACLLQAARQLGLTFIYCANEQLYN